MTSGTPSENHSSAGGGWWGMLQLPWRARTSWEHLACLSRPAQSYLLVFGWHSCLPLGPTWKRPHQLGVCLFENKVLCAAVARISILSGPRGFPYHLDMLKRVQQWAVFLLWCVLHLCTDHAALGSALRDWPKRRSADVLQPSFPASSPQPARVPAVSVVPAGVPGRKDNGFWPWHAYARPSVPSPPAACIPPLQNARQGLHFIWESLYLIALIVVLRLCRTSWVLIYFKFTDRAGALQYFCELLSIFRQHWGLFSPLPQTGTALFVSSPLHYAAF